MDERLLAEVLARPEEDEPRLAFADAADARRDPRGAFIRAQVTLARLNRAHRIDDEVRDPARATEKELSARHREEWTRPVAGLVKYAELRRGFVEDVFLGAREFLDRAADLYARAPILYVALAPGAGALVDELAASPHLGRLRSLDLGKAGLGDRGIRTLAASPYVRNLRWLNLSDNDIGRAGLEALAASPNLPSLRYVEFRRNPAGDPTPRPGGVEATTGEIFDWETPPLGEELIARFGPLPWLTYQTDHRMFWPPAVDAV